MSTTDGKTLNDYELSGWIKVASSESADGKKTSAEGEDEEDFVFIYDFRNIKR